MEEFGRQRSPSTRNRDEEFLGRETNGFRRRSPGTRGGPRRRSRSPIPIDRYQPGRDYNPPREYRRRSPPPPTHKDIDRYVPGQEPAMPLFNPIMNPLQLDYQVGFSYFAEWWRKENEIKEEKERQKTGARRPPPTLKGDREAREEREKERVLIQAAYDEYKTKIHAQQSRLFVHQHKTEEWFKERYDPDLRSVLRQRLAEHRRGIYGQWRTDLESGVFDEFNLEGIYKADSNGLGGVIEKEEGEASAATETLGVGDLVPAKGADLKDDAVHQPALLIKTIAPQVSRDKLEAFCKEHLGDADGGFKWLSLSDPNPMKKFHRIGWIMLYPGGDAAEEDDEEGAVDDADRGDGRDEDEEEGAEKEDKMDVTASTPKPKTAVDKALLEINGKAIEDEEKGNFTCHVGIHVPASTPRKRALWDLFSAPERVERDLDLAIRLVSKLEQDLGDDINAVSKIEERVEEIRNKGLLQAVGIPGSKPAKESTAANDDEREEGEDDEMEEGEEGAWDEDVDDEELLTKKKKLDLLVEYLRRVFNFCFFCVFESDSVHELTRKCPGGHLRRPRASLTTSAKACAKASAYGEEFPLKKQADANEDQEGNDGTTRAENKQSFHKNNKAHQQLQRAFNWVKTFEDKIYQILEPESVDLIKLGGRPLEQALDEELKKHVKQEDESKFRCRAPDCTKLFKGENFWRKHVEKRHTEWYEALKKELNEINLYVLDPAHITPSRSDSSTQGHFVSGHGPTGTPRGFSLQSMPQFGLGPGMSGNGTFSATLGNYPVAVPGGWGMQAGAMSDGVGQIGPMGRGPRLNNRMRGPYDRPPNSGRGGRWGGGRLTPPGAGRKMGNQQRFPDAAPAAVGPKEATAGRSLKSYEDLDAVGGSGNGELDY